MQETVDRDVHRVAGAAGDDCWPGWGGQIAAEGENIRVAFQIVAAGIEVDIDTVAVIRNIRQNVERSPWVMHGLEFQKLDTATQLALRYLAIE